MSHAIGRSLTGRQPYSTGLPRRDTSDSANLLVAVEPNCDDELEEGEIKEVGFIHEQQIPFRGGAVSPPLRTSPVEAASMAISKAYPLNPVSTSAFVDPTPSHSNEKRGRYNDGPLGRVYSPLPYQERLVKSFPSGATTGRPLRDMSPYLRPQLPVSARASDKEVDALGATKPMTGSSRKALHDETKCLSVREPSGRTGYDCAESGYASPTSSGKRSHTSSLGAEALPYTEKRQRRDHLAVHGQWVAPRAVSSADTPPYPWRHAHHDVAQDSTDAAHASTAGLASSGGIPRTPWVGKRPHAFEIGQRGNHLATHGDWVAPNTMSAAAIPASPSLHEHGQTMQNRPDSGYPSSTGVTSSGRIFRAAPVAHQAQDHEHRQYVAPTTAASTQSHRPRAHELNRHTAHELRPAARDGEPVSNGSRLHNRSPTEWFNYRDIPSRIDARPGSDVVKPSGRVVLEGDNRAGTGDDMSLQLTARPIQPHAVDIHWTVQDVNRLLERTARQRLDAKRARLMAFINTLKRKIASFDMDYPRSAAELSMIAGTSSRPWPLGQWGNPFQPGWAWERFDPHRLLPGHPKFLDRHTPKFQRLAQEASLLSFAERSNVQRAVVSIALRLRLTLDQTVLEPDVFRICRTDPRTIPHGVRRRFGVLPGGDDLCSEFHLHDLGYYITLQRSGPALKLKGRGEVECQELRTQRKRWMDALSSFVLVWLPKNLAALDEPDVQRFPKGPESFSRRLEEPDRTYSGEVDTMRSIWEHLLRCGLTTSELRHQVREYLERDNEGKESYMPHLQNTKGQGMTQDQRRQYAYDRAKWFPITSPTDLRISIKLTEEEVDRVLRRQKDQFSDEWFVY